MMGLKALGSGIIHLKSGWRTDQISGEDVEDARAVKLDPDEEGLAEFRAGNIFTLNKGEYKDQTKHKCNLFYKFSYILSLLWVLRSSWEITGVCPP